MNEIQRNINMQANGQKIARIGKMIARYGLVVILIWIGLLKFTSYEAAGIKPLVTNSPLMSWGYSVLSVQGLAIALGITEIVAALFIASRRFLPRLCALGSLMAAFMFLITLSFLLTTPPAWQPDYGFPFLSPMPGQFLLKDILGLGVAVWSMGEAMNAAPKIKP